MPLCAAPGISNSALETAEDNLAELTAQAQAFADKQLPVLEALQIVNADLILTHRCLGSPK